MASNAKIAETPKATENGSSGRSRDNNISGERQQEFAVMVSVRFKTYCAATGRRRLPATHADGSVLRVTVAGKRTGEGTIQISKRKTKGGIMMDG